MTVSQDLRNIGAMAGVAASLLTPIDTAWAQDLKGPQQGVVLPPVRFFVEPTVGAAYTVYKVNFPVDLTFSSLTNYGLSVTAGNHPKDLVPFGLGESGSLISKLPAGSFNVTIVGPNGANVQVEPVPSAAEAVMSLPVTGKPLSLHLLKDSSGKSVNSALLEVNGEGKLQQSTDLIHWKPTDALSPDFKGTMVVAGLSGLASPLYLRLMEDQPTLSLAYNQEGKPVLTITSTTDGHRLQVADKVGEFRDTDIEVSKGTLSLKIDPSGAARFYRTRK